MGDVVVFFIFTVIVISVFGVLVWAFLNVPPIVIYIGLFAIWFLITVYQVQKRRIAEQKLADLDYKKKSTAEYYENRIKIADEYYENAQQKATELRKSTEDELSEIRSEIDSAEKTLNDLQRELSPVEVSIDKYEDISSTELMLKIRELKERQKNALPTFGRMDKRRQMYRCFNAECDAILLNLNDYNVGKAIPKIRTAYEYINKLFAQDGFRIDEHYLELKYREVELAYAYDKQRNSEKADNTLLDAHTSADKLLKEADNTLRKAYVSADSILEEAKRDLKSLYNSSFKASEEAKKDLEIAKAEKAQIEKDIDGLKAEADSLQRPLLPYTIGIDPYDNLKSDEIKNQLSVLQGKERDMVQNETAFSIAVPSKYSNFNKKRQMMLSFNTQCTRVFENLTIANSDTARAKIQRSYESVNRIFASDGVQISEEYLQAKFEELHLFYAYAVKVKEERETQKSIREQLQEEAKAQRELEREREKIDKEIKHFDIERGKLLKYLNKVNNDVERQLYVDRIHELEDELKKLRSDKEHVLERERNTRSGHVYVISNIGSFGENVYKIGMTRRYEPRDRIDELSSASVPFKFDIHALIFSNDAPALEATLHQAFKDRQVNKVNPRKEFFKVDLEEIKKIVRENFDGLAKFTDIPEAEEYRETLRILAGGQEKDDYISDAVLPELPIEDFPTILLQNSDYSQESLFN